MIFSFASDGMFLFAVGIVATIMPPFGAITILGAVWARASAKAAAIALTIGMSLAAGLFVLDLRGDLQQFAEDTLYLRSGLVFLVTLTIHTLFSLFSHTDQPDQMSELKGVFASRQLKSIALGVGVFILGIYVFLSFAR